MNLASGKTLFSISFDGFHHQVCHLAWSNLFIRIHLIFLQITIFIINYKIVNDEHYGDVTCIISLIQAELQR